MAFFSNFRNQMMQPQSRFAPMGMGIGGLFGGMGGYNPYQQRMPFGGGGYNPYQQQRMPFGGGGYNPYQQQRMPFGGGGFNPYQQQRMPFGGGGYNPYQQQRMPFGGGGFNPYQQQPGPQAPPSINDLFSGLDEGARADFFNRFGLATKSPAGAAAPPSANERSLTDLFSGLEPGSPEYQASVASLKEEIARAGQELGAIEKASNWVERSGRDPLQGDFDAQIRRAQGAWNLPMLAAFSDTEKYDLSQQLQQPGGADMATATGVSDQGAGLPSGYAWDAPADKMYSSMMPPSGGRWAYGPEGDRIEVGGGSVPEFTPPAEPQLPVTMPTTTVPPFTSSTFGLQQQLGNIPQFDPSQLQGRLAELEGRNVPQFDPSQLQGRLAELEGRNVPQFDPIQIQEQMGGLQQQLGNIPQFDPTGIQSQIAALQNRQAPTFNQFDPTDLQSQIAALQDRGIPQFDASGLQQRLSALEGAGGFNPSGLQQRLSALEGGGGFDPSGLQQRLASLEGAGGFDPTELQERLASLEGAGGFDPSGLQKRLAELEAIKVPGLDPIPSFDPIPGFDPTELLQKGPLPPPVPSPDVPPGRVVSPQPVGRPILLPDQIYRPERSKREELQSAIDGLTRGIRAPTAEEQARADQLQAELDSMGPQLPVGAPTLPFARVPERVVSPQPGGAQSLLHGTPSVGEPFLKERPPGYDPSEELQFAVPGPVRPPGGFTAVDRTGPPPLVPSPLPVLPGEPSRRERGLQPGDARRLGLEDEIIGGQLPELPQAEKDRREKLYQDRKAAQQKLMDENPLQPRNPAGVNPPPGYYFGGMYDMDDNPQYVQGTPPPGFPPMTPINQSPMPQLPAPAPLPGPTQIGGHPSTELEEARSRWAQQGEADDISDEEWGRANMLLRGLSPSMYQGRTPRELAIGKLAGRLDTERSRRQREDPKWRAENLSMRIPEIGAPAAPPGPLQQLLMEQQRMGGSRGYAAPDLGRNYSPPMGLGRPNPRGVGGIRAIPRTSVGGPRMNMNISGLYGAR